MVLYSITSSITPGVIAYVDIRSPFGGGGSVMAQRLLSLGATVEMTRNNSVTHVIFRNGDPATKFWAEKRGIYIVTPAWVKACVDEKVTFRYFSIVISSDPSSRNLLLH